MAGHMARSLLGATASVIRGLDIDRVPTLSPELDLGFVFTAGD